MNLQVKGARWVWDEAKLVDAKNKFWLIPELLLSTCYVLNPRRWEGRKGTLKWVIIPSYSILTPQRWRIAKVFTPCLRHGRYKIKLFEVSLPLTSLSVTLLPVAFHTWLHLKSRHCSRYSRTPSSTLYLVVVVVVVFWFFYVTASKGGLRQENYRQTGK